MGSLPLKLLPFLAALVTGQLLPQMGGAQVKITEQPFLVSNAQHLNQIVWTMIGNTIKESIYCVSEAPVSQLRFVCTDCEQKNITDMVPALNSAQDLTRSAGFPTVVLKLSTVNANWTGATVVCQAALNGGTVDSAPATVDVRFLRQPHVTDASGQGPVLIPNQGYRFYVECQRGPDGYCMQSGRRKTLRCAVQAHPAATTFRWLKNGVATSGNGAEITIGTEMIGHSLQCTANNGLYSDIEMPTSQAVQIDPYSAAHVVQDNFAVVQSQAPFQGISGQIQMGADVNMQCIIEGNPRPVVYWKMKRTNGQIMDAPCPQGYDGTYQEVNVNTLQGLQSSLTRLKTQCTLRVANYSFSGQYWCSACSVVSQGHPECSPSDDTPPSSVLTLNVQGPPMQSDTPISVEQMPNSNNVIVGVPYCAEPVPQMPRGVVFTIDQNELQVGQRWENFRFETNIQNNSVANCFLARLQVSPYREEDRYRPISLRVTNAVGTKSIPFTLDSLLGGGSALSGRLSPWWIVLLVLLPIAAILVCAVFLCYRRRLPCFNGVKKEHTDYGDSTAKANLSVRSTLYGDDVPPRLYQQPEPATAYDAAVYAAYCDSRMSSTSNASRQPRSPSYQEGLNYAEMRLSSDRTPVVSHAQPMAEEPATHSAHAHHQFSSPTVVLNPSINSVV